MGIELYIRWGSTGTDQSPMIEPLSAYECGSLWCVVVRRTVQGHADSQASEKARTCALDGARSTSTPSGGKLDFVIFCTLKINVFYL